MVAAIPPPLDQVIRFVASEPFVKAAIFPGATFVAVLGILSVWYERKLLARVMLRIGPFHVGKYGGWLQVVADAVKFLSKEYITGLSIGLTSVCFWSLCWLLCLPYR
jgi:NADH:ubiquinone oxidoreductase subunit H